MSRELHDALVRFYREAGLPASSFWIGPEHPTLEQVAIELLRERASARVLELGFQAGGFAIPLVAALQERATFEYTGVDNLGYPSAVHPRLLHRFLERNGLLRGRVRFLLGSSSGWLRRVDQQFDLVLLDVLKSLYPEAVRITVRRGLIAPGGHLLVHDVLGRAKHVWPDCESTLRAAGFTVTVRTEVPEGLAVATATRDVPVPPPSLADRAAFIASAASAELRGLRWQVRRSVRLM